MDITMSKSTHFFEQPSYGQLTKLLDKGKITEISRKHNGEKYVKKLNCFTHLLTMLYAVIMQFDSPREIETAMMAEVNKLHHIGIKTVPKRSIISNANSRQSEMIFGEIYRGMYEQNRKHIPEELRTFSSQFPYNTMASKEYDPALLELNSEDSPITLPLDADTDLIWNKYGDCLVTQLATESAKQQLSGEEIKDFRASNSYNLKHNGRFVLAPFWFVYYTYNNEKHYFIMDGLGENTAMTTPVDQEEVKFVKGKETIKTLVTWLWTLAILMFFIAGFKSALITLGVWFVAKLIVDGIMNKQIKKRLNASREARRAAAAKL